MRNQRIWTRAAGAAALLAALAALCACGYFDLLVPREPDPEDPPDTGTTWQVTIGEASEARSLLLTADGGFVIAGTTDAGVARQLDLWLIKTDGAGQKQWSQAFGGSGNDDGRCVRQTPDGGYILVGSTSSFGAGGSDVYLVKTDAEGNLQWEKTFGGTAAEHGYSIECIEDGGYVIAGSTASAGAGLADVYLIKTDSAGNEDWHKTFGGPYSDEGYAVRQAADGGYVVAGYTQGTGSFAGDDNAWLIKTLETGDMEWNEPFSVDALVAGDEAYYDEQARDVQVTADGYVLAGYTHSVGAGDFDAWLIKTDSAGQKQWDKTHGGGAWDQTDAVVLTADGGYALTGMSRNLGGYFQAWLLKTDGGGVEEWSRFFGGPSSEEWGYCLQPAADEGYILAGSTTAGGPQAYLVYYKP